MAKLASLLTEHEVAYQLGISPLTLRRWRWSGDGPPFRKIGAAVRYHPDDVEEYINRALRTSTLDPGEKQ